MARSGKQAWEKYYQGNNGVTVRVKKAAPYYSDEKTTKQEGSLTINTSVIYSDVFSQHIRAGGNNKIAFQFVANGPVYYSGVDNFRKPGGVSGVGLKPENFGLANRTFTSATAYYDFVVNALDSRLQNNEIGGELYEYLLATLNYAKNGTLDFADIQKDGLPWGEINSFFGEVAGPLACITGHCANISTIIPSVSGCHIYIPGDSTPLYDYKLINTGLGKEYMISAKAGKNISNVVKPQFIIGPLNGITNDTKLTQLKSTDAYKVLEELNNYEVKSGPFYAYQVISNSLTKGMIDSIMTVYRTNDDGDKKLPNPSLLEPFINSVKSSHGVMLGKEPKDMNVGLIRYVCEQEIKKWSNTAVANSQLKQIFEKYLGYTRVIYVKMTASPAENPKFTAFGGDQNSVKKVTRVELRSKNTTQKRAGDKVGYQVS